MSPERGGWALIAQLNGRAADQDRLEDGSAGANTGGRVIYAVPGLRWRGSLGLGVEASVQIPVSQSLDGDQTEHTTARFALLLGR